MEKKFIMDTRLKDSTKSKLRHLAMQAKQIIKSDGLNTE